MWTQPFWSCCIQRITRKAFYPKSLNELVSYPFAILQMGKLSNGDGCTSLHQGST